MLVQILPGSQARSRTRTVDGMFEQQCYRVHCVPDSRVVQRELGNQPAPESFIQNTSREQWYDSIHEEFEGTSFRLWLLDGDNRILNDVQGSLGFWTAALNKSEFRLRNAIASPAGLLTVSTPRPRLITTNAADPAGVAAEFGLLMFGSRKALELLSRHDWWVKQISPLVCQLSSLRPIEHAARINPGIAQLLRLKKVSATSFRVPNLSRPYGRPHLCVNSRLA